MTSGRNDTEERRDMYMGIGRMEYKVLLVGDTEPLATELASLFEANGSQVTRAVGTDVLTESHDICVACWKDRGSCPVQFLRDYQDENPQTYLMCCAAEPDPWVRSFLANAGLTPDVVISAQIPAKDILAEAKRLLAFERGDRREHLVVCVDDDAEFLWSLEQSLADRLAVKAPFETSFEFFTNPQEAEELLAQCSGSDTPVAMIITDHVMPGLTGVELLARAKKLAPFSVRVLLTGQAGMDAVVDAVNSRTLDHYISKPIGDLDEFVRTLSHLLKEYHLSLRSRLDSWQTTEQYQFLKRLAKLQTLEETLEAVVAFVAHTLDAERVSLMLRDEDRLTVRASRGLPEDVASISVPVGSGVAGRVFETGSPLYVTDPSELGIETPVDSPCSVFASVPLLVAPMAVGERPLGTINVTNRRGDRPLARSEMMFLSHTADIAAIAISNHQEHAQKEEANFGALRSLALAVEAKDKYTRGHSERVTLYSVGVGEKLGLGPREIENLERAAIMHDVGKIGVPEHIIHKPGRLSDDEFEHIRQHSVIGERIVSDLAFMADALPIIRGHHEQLDGSGYPDGLKGEEIVLGARIVGVADAYDAMTSERPYRAAMGHAGALAELRRHAGKQFDPQCVEALVELLGELFDEFEEENARQGAAEGQSIGSAGS